MRSNVMIALAVAILAAPIQKRHRSLSVPDGAVFKAAATLIES